MPEAKTPQGRYNQMQAKARNWRILQLRGAWATIKNMEHTDSLEICLMIDNILQDMGAEREQDKRARERRELEERFNAKIR